MEPDPRADLGAYLLAAAVLPVEQLQATGDIVSALRLRGQREMHWRDENDQRRKLLTAAIAELEALYVVVVRVDGTESSERHRPYAPKIPSVPGSGEPPFRPPRTAVVGT